MSTHSKSQKNILAMVPKRGTNTVTVPWKWEENIRTPGSGFFYSHLPTIQSSFLVLCPRPLCLATLSVPSSLEHQIHISNRLFDLRSLNLTWPIQSSFSTPKELFTTCSLPHPQAHFYSCSPQNSSSHSWFLFPSNPFHVIPPTLTSEHIQIQLLLTTTNATSLVWSPTSLT